MSKFNPKTITKRTTNLAGGEAFQASPKLEIISLLATSFVQPQYYRSTQAGLTRLNQLIDVIPDKKLLAKAALYARRELGMRSITHALAAELAARAKGEVWTKNFYDRIVYRPDDATEILAYYLERYGKPIPNALKKGLALALPRFNEYRLAKYRGEGKKISLVDVVNLVHPNSTPAISKLVEGTLRSTDTWETKLTQAGDDEEKKRQAWTDLVKEDKLPYFATLRNLRNIMQQAPGVLDKALEKVTNEEAIRNSLVMPFRYVTALNAIKQESGPETRRVIAALNQAVDTSLANIPEFQGDTLVVLDVSGSMNGRPSEVGSLFAAALVKRNNADLILFSNHAEYKNLNIADSTITLAHSILFSVGGTNFHSIFKTANRAYDRVFILSDMQGWMGYSVPTKTLEEYKQKTGANPKIYSFDLQGYGTLEFPEENIYAIAGFSDKVFDLVALLEKDRDALINKIQEISFAEQADVK